MQVQSGKLWYTVVYISAEKVYSWKAPIKDTKNLSSK